MRTDGQREELLKWRRKMHDMHLLTHSLTLAWLWGRGLELCCRCSLFVSPRCSALSLCSVGLLLCVMLLIYIVYNLLLLLFFVAYTICKTRYCCSG